MASVSVVGAVVTASERITGAQTTVPLAVSPASGLHDGDQVSVRSVQPGQWPENIPLTIVQCASLAQAGCDTSTAMRIITKEDGSFDEKFTVHGQITTSYGPSYCDRGEVCFVVVANDAITLAGAQQLFFELVPTEPLPVPEPPTVPPPGTACVTPSTKGGFLAFTRTVIENNATNEDIWVMDADGQNAQRLTDHAARDSEPAVSADGTKLAFESERPPAQARGPRIFVMGVDGSNVSNVPSGVARNPSWAPDEPLLAYDAYPQPGDQGAVNDEIIVSREDGSAKKRLTRSPDPPNSPSTRPSWSPDGTKIAFTRTVGGSAGQPSHDEIYVMDADGGGQRQLTTAGPGELNAFEPKWSPDGQSLVFARWREVSNAEVHRVNVDGSGLRRLTTDVSVDRAPTWSPDGTSVAFMSNRDGDFDIFVMNAADGGGQHPITVNRVTDRFPDWSGCGGPRPPKCETSLAVGIVDARAGCFLEKTRGSGVYATVDPIKVNGLELTPVGGPVVVDTKARRIRTESGGRLTLNAELLGTVTITGGTIDWTLPERGSGGGYQLAAFSVGPSASLGGLSLAGGATARLVEGATVLDVSITLPSPFPSGRLGLKADNTTRDLHVSEAQVKLDAPYLGLRNVHFRYQEPAHFEGGGDLMLPGGSSVGADLAVDNMEITLFEARASKIPIGPVVLQNAVLKYQSGGQGAPASFSAEGTASVGPDFLGNLPVLEVGAGMSYLASDPPEFTARGDVDLVGIRVGGATLYAKGQTVFFRGNVHLSFLNDFVYADALIDLGYQSASRWNAGAGANGCVDTKTIFGRLCTGGDVVISSRGAAACVNTFLGRFGAGANWGENVRLFLGACDVGPYTADVSRSSLRRVGGPSPAWQVRVSGKSPFEVFRVQGRNAVPNIVLTGPGGRRIEGSANPDELRVDEEAGVILVNVREERASYLFVDDAKAGEWKVVSGPGSSAIVEIGSASGLPEAEVSARVTGTDRSRTVVYDVRPIDGQRVQLFEVGPETMHLIGVARGAHGELRFTPADGPAGKRQILAAVTQDGLPRITTTVATYEAPKPEVPKAPKHLRAKRTKKGVNVTWKRVKGADRCVVVVSTADGRRIEIATRKPKALIKGIGRKDTAKITVTGVSDTGRLGKAATVKVKAPKSKRQ